MCVCACAYVSVYHLEVLILQFIHKFIYKLEASIGEPYTNYLIEKNVIKVLL